MDETGSTESRGRPWRYIIALVVLVIAVLLLGAYAIHRDRENRDLRAQIQRESERLAGLDELARQHSEMSDDFQQCRKKLKEEEDLTVKVRSVCNTDRSELAMRRHELAILDRQSTANDNRKKAFELLQKSIFEAGDGALMQLSSRQGRMLLELSDTVLFDSGSAKLSRDGEFALMEVAVFLRKFPDRKISIGGHTDSRVQEGGRSKYSNNWELSAARALSVFNFLVQARMPAANLSIAGYGPNEPIADNRTQAGRQRNRRIELEFVPSEDELPWLISAP